MRDFDYSNYELKASTGDLNAITQAMLDAQVEREVSQKKSAHNRYHARLHKAVSGQRSKIESNGNVKQYVGKPSEDRMHYGQQLIKGCQEAVALRIRAYAFMGDQEGLVKAAGGRKSNVQTQMYRFGHDDVLAHYALQACIAGISGGTQSLQSVEYALGSKIELECRQEAVRQASSVIAVITQNGLHKRKNDQRKQKAFLKFMMEQTGQEALDYIKVNQLKKVITEEHKAYLKARRHEPLVDFREWSLADKANMGGALVQIVKNCGLIELYQTHNKSSFYIRGTAQALELIEHYQNSMLGQLSDTCPLVCKPRQWTKENIRDGIYYTTLSSPLALIKHRTPMQLKRMSDEATDAPLFWSAINGVMNTNWQINPYVHELLSAVVSRAAEDKDAALPIEGLAPLVYADAPRTPIWIDEHLEARDAYYAAKEANPHHEGSAEYQEREREYSRWKMATTAWYASQATYQSERRQVLEKLNQATAYLDAPNGLYFGYTVDFRGRVYCMSSGISPQGDDLSKGLLQFHKGKALGKRGAYWLKVHAANLFGFDKETFDNRVKWTEENLETLLRIGRDPLANENVDLWIGGRSRWEDTQGRMVSCEAPFQAYAVCRELVGWVEQGSAFESRLAIPLDGSCSGLQNLAMALRCSETAKAVNVLPNETIADIYGMVADRVDAAIRGETEDTVEEGANDQTPPTVYAQQWLKFLTIFGKGRVTRSETKRPVMTFVYGSEVVGYKDQIMADTIRPAFKAYREAVSEGRMEEDAWPFDSDGYKAATYMAKKIYAAVQAQVDRPARFMLWAQQAVAAVVKVKKKKVELEWAEATQAYIDGLLATDPNAIDHTGKLRKKYAPGAPKRKPVIVEWTTPTGFKVMQFANEQDNQELKITIDNTKVRRQYLSDTDVANTRAHRSSIAPNTVHSFDAAHLQMVVAYAMDKGMSEFALIHDSFGTYACDTDEFSACIRQAFHDMYSKTDVVQGIHDEWLEDFIACGGDEGDFPPLFEYGDLDRAVVLDSTYAFS